MDKNLDYLFNEASLYTKEIFKVFEIENDKYVINRHELDAFLNYIGKNQDRVITYCHCCKKIFPFEIRSKLHLFSSFMGTAYMGLSGQGMVNLDISDGEISGVQPPYDKEFILENEIWYIDYSLTCTNNCHHNYMLFISIELKEGSFIVRKIGQNPSMLSVKGFEFDKYKKQLKGINAYDDYKKADLSYADHFFVGAFAYLRRIFEKMVNQYIYGVALTDNHMDTKIQAAKHKFDPRIHDTLTNLYGILSKSIHELDEEESKEYYTYLKAVVDIQLEYIKTEEEKEKQTQDLSSILNTIASKFKK